MGKSFAIEPLPQAQQLLERRARQSRSSSAGPGVFPGPAPSSLGAVATRGCGPAANCA